MIIGSSAVLMAAGGSVPLLPGLDRLGAHLLAAVEDADEGAAQAADYDKAAVVTLAGPMDCRGGLSYPQLVGIGGRRDVCI